MQGTSDSSSRFLYKLEARHDTIPLAQPNQIGPYEDETCTMGTRILGNAMILTLCVLVISGDFALSLVYIIIYTECTSMFRKLVVNSHYLRISEMEMGNFCPKFACSYYHLSSTAECGIDHQYHACFVSLRGRHDL